MLSHHDDGMTYHSYIEATVRHDVSHITSEQHTSTRFQVRLWVVRTNLKACE